MDRNEFVKKMESASTSISIEELKNHFADVIEHAKIDTDLGDKRWSIIAMEEMAECQQALSKMMRGKGDMANLEEEIADVFLSLGMVMGVYEIDEETIIKAMHVKMDRCKEKQSKEGMFR